VLRGLPQPCLPRVFTQGVRKHIVVERVVELQEAALPCAGAAQRRAAAPGPVSLTQGVCPVRPLVLPPPEAWVAGPTSGVGARPPAVPPPGTPAPELPAATPCGPLLTGAPDGELPAPGTSGTCDASSPGEIAGSP
jgi:hypothetical protein